MAALTKTNRRSAINTFKLKPALAAIRSFSKSENDQITAIDQAIDAGLRSEWLAPSEVQFARNKEADPTIPVKWKDWQQVDSVDTPNADFKAKFLNAVDNQWIKDFLAPDDEVPFDTEVDTPNDITADIPL